MDACAACGARPGSADVGDGAAGFTALVTGALATGVGVALDAWLRPPVRVHAPVRTPLIAGATVGLPRPVRGLLPAGHVRQGLLDDDRTRGGG